MQLVAVLPDGSLSVLGRSWYSRLGCELAFIHAQAHAREQANTTALSSLGGDASTPLQRARAVVPAASAAGEVAAAGYDSVLGAVVALLWCGSRTVFICLKRLRHCCLDIRASKCTPQLHAKSRLRAVPSSAAAHRRRPVYVPQTGAKHVWASVHAVPWAMGFGTWSRVAGGHLVLGQRSAGPDSSVLGGHSSDCLAVRAQLSSAPAGNIGALLPKLFP